MLFAAGGKRGQFWKSSIDHDSCTRALQPAAQSFEKSDDYKVEFGLHWNYLSPYVWCISVSSVHCSQDPQVQISANLTLKLSSTVLFTHLKIILL